RPAGGAGAGDVGVSGGDVFGRRVVGAGGDRAAERLAGAPFGIGRRSGARGGIAWRDVCRTGARDRGGVAVVDGGEAKPATRARLGPEDYTTVFWRSTRRSCRPLPISV